MNLILLFKEDFITKDVVRLSDFRKEHIVTVLKSKPGDQLCVGVCDGLMGQGKVIRINKNVELQVTLTQEPPKPLPLTLIMPLARPPVFKRTLLCAASLGIKKMYVLNFNRTEKSLWNSSSLKPEAIKEQLILGLQQAKDTLMPEVILQPRFRPFVQDQLLGLIKNTLALVAHPGGQETVPAIKQPLTLLIGPEGGLVDFEIQELQHLGFKAVDLGPRIIRVESVLPYLVGKIF